MLKTVCPRWQAWWRWVWVVSLTAMLISACNSTKINHSKLPPSEMPLTPCRVVQHAMGETCIPNNPEQMVIISYEILGHVLSLGVKPIGSNALRKERFSQEKTQNYLMQKQPSTLPSETISVKPDRAIICCTGRAILYETAKPNEWCRVRKQKSLSNTLARAKRVGANKPPPQKSMSLGRGDQHRQLPQ